MKKRRCTAILLIAVIVASTLGCKKEKEEPIVAEIPITVPEPVEKLTEEEIPLVIKEIMTEEEAEDFYYNVFALDNTIMTTAYLNELELSDNGRNLLKDYAAVTELVNLWNTLSKDEVIEGEIIESWNMYDGFPSDMISENDDCYFWSWSLAYKAEDIQKVADWYYGKGCIDVSAYEGSETSYMTQNGYLLYIPGQIDEKRVVSKLKKIEICEDRAFLYLERVDIDTNKFRKYGIYGDEWLENDIEFYRVNRSMDEVFDTYLKYVDMISAGIYRCTIELYKDKTGVHYKNYYNYATGEYKVTNVDGTALFSDYRLSDECVVDRLQMNSKIYVYSVIYYGEELGKVMYLSDKGYYEYGYVRMSDIEMIKE